MSEERESRADRLRRRRSAKRDQPDTDESSKQSKPDEQGEPAESDGTAKRGESAEVATPDETDDEPTSVKEEQVGTYMYLPESQHRKLNHVYNRLKADYEFEFEEEFQKNRHFYPVLVQLGMDALAEESAEDIREQVRELHQE